LFQFAESGHYAFKLKFYLLISYLTSGNLRVKNDRAKNGWQLLQH